MFDIYGHDAERFALKLAVDIFELDVLYYTDYNVFKGRDSFGNIWWCHVACKSIRFVLTGRVLRIEEEKCFPSNVSGEVLQFFFSISLFK